MANSVQIDIVALTQKFESEMAKVQKGLAKLEGEASKVSDQISGFGDMAGKVGQFFTAFASVAAVEKAAKAIYAFTQAVSDSVGEQSRLAQRLGLSAEFVDRLDQAFARSHVDVETARTAINRFTKTVGNASGGNIEAIKTFEALGISVDELSKLSPEDQILRTADAISRLQNAAQQEDFLTALFGRGAGNILNLFQKGSEGIKAAMADAVPMTDKMRANFEVLDKATLDMNAEWTQMSREVADRMAPALIDAITLFTAGMKVAREHMDEISIAATMLSGVFGALPEALKFAKNQMGKGGGGGGGFGGFQRWILGDLRGIVPPAGAKAAPGAPAIAAPKKAPKGPPIQGERNKIFQEFEKGFPHQLNIDKAIGADNARMELFAKKQKENMFLPNALRDELAFNQANQEVMTKRAEAAQHLKRLGQDVEAVGKRDLEIQTQINRQYALASDAQKKLLAAKTRELELAQKLQGMREATPGGQFAIAKRDLEAMRKNGQITVKEFQERMAEAETEKRKGIGIPLNPGEEFRNKVNAIDRDNGLGAGEKRLAKMAASVELHEKQMAKMEGLGAKATPFEDLAMRLDKLNLALQSGAITKGQYARATSDIAREKFDLNSPRLSGAQMAGSQEAYKTIVSAMFAPNRDPQLQVAKNTQAMVGILGAINQRMAAQVQQNLNMVN